MSLKKKYYTMKKDEFQYYLNQIKTDSRTLHFFSNKEKNYFFYTDDDCIQSLLELHKIQMKFDQFIQSLDKQKQEWIVESLIIDEIKTTNATENIYSTRKNIFSLLKQVSSIKDKKIKSILLAYQFIQSDEVQVTDLNSIRKLYDVMMKNAFDSNDDKPDGKLFRKDSVNVTNGLKSVHRGFYPESEIMKGLEEFIGIYKNSKLDIYQRLILSHFLFETIHPFYDGNGRLGRLLFSMELLQKEKTCCAYVISSSINKKKKDYYSALEEARDIHSFGCLNHYFTQMAEILHSGLEEIHQHFNNCEIEYQQLIKQSNEVKMTKTERKVVEYLIKASCFSYYGVTNDQIISACQVSKRSVMTILSKLRQDDVLSDTKIGAFDYHKIRNIKIMSDSDINSEDDM